MIVVRNPGCRLLQRILRGISYDKPWVLEFLFELGGPSVGLDPPDVAALFARYLDLWVRDEALGFEGVFFTEHHFSRSHSPSRISSSRDSRREPRSSGSASWGSCCPTTTRRG